MLLDCMIAWVLIDWLPSIYLYSFIIYSGHLSQHLDWLIDCTWNISHLILPKTLGLSMQINEIFQNLNWTSIKLDWIYSPLAQRLVLCAPNCMCAVVIQFQLEKSWVIDWTLTHAISTWTCWTASILFQNIGCWIPAMEASLTCSTSVVCQLCLHSRESATGILLSCLTVYQWHVDFTWVNWIYPNRSCRVEPLYWCVV